MRSRHALIIEDEILIALEIEELLKEQGFTSIAIAESPLEALDCALKRKPDLITADYRIVDGTGVEAVKMIMAHLGPIPVVYVTGHAKALDGQQDGVVVQKPIRPNILAGAWQHALQAA